MQSRWPAARFLLFRASAFLVEISFSKNGCILASARSSTANAYARSKTADNFQTNQPSEKKKSAHSCLRCQSFAYHSETNWTFFDSWCEKMNILGRIVRTTIYCRAPLAASGHRSIIPIAVSSSTNYQIQYASKSTKAGAGDSATAEGNAPAGTKKPKTAPKITLVGPDHSVSIMNLDEAQKISKRRDLKLVKVVDLDLKTQRPVYK